MLICQTSLINHLKRQFTAPMVRTIEAYAGQISGWREDAINITAQLPAIFVAFVDGRPMAYPRYHQFGLLICTQNDTSTVLESHQDNLSLSTEVSRWLQENFNFNADGGRGTYRIQKENTTSIMIRNDARFCIIGLNLYIEDHRR